MAESGSGLRTLDSLCGADGTNRDTFGLVILGYLGSQQLDGATICGGVLKPHRGRNDCMDAARCVVCLSLISVLAGCGGGSGDGNYAGTWATASGSIVTSTCKIGGQITTISISATGNIAIVASTNSEIFLTLINGCNIQYNIEGLTATAILGQSCTTNSDGGRTGTISIGVSRITLSADGKSLTSTMSAACVDTTETCTQSWNISATEV